MQWTRTYADDERRCSFCHRKEPETGDLIESPHPPRRFICAACVAACTSILNQKDRLQPGQVIEVKYNPNPV